MAASKPTTTYYNNQYTEIQIERTKTITLQTKDEFIKTEELFTYLNNLDMINSIECIQRITIKEQQFHEVTFKDDETRVIQECKLQQKDIIIDGKSLRLIPTRTMRDLVKKPIMKVLIFEAPYELADRHILQKMRQYGELSEPMVYHHQYRGSPVYNGVRSVNFKRIVTPIPTTTFIQGNRIKFKHEGQDRSPICGFCRQKGHFRDECPGQQDRDQPQKKQDKEMSKSWAEIVEGQKEILRQKKVSDLMERQDEEGYEFQRRRGARPKRKITQTDEEDKMNKSMRQEEIEENQHSKEENMDKNEKHSEEGKNEGETIEDEQYSEKENESEQMESENEHIDSDESISDLDEKTDDQSYYSGGESDFQSGQEVKNINDNEGITESQVEDQKRWDSGIDQQWDSDWQK